MFDNQKNIKDYQVEGHSYQLIGKVLKLEKMSYAL